LQKTRSFQFRVQAGTRTEKERLIAEQVVSLGTVPSAGANQAVIPITVNGITAKLACELIVIGASAGP